MLRKKKEKKPSWGQISIIACDEGWQLKAVDYSQQTSYQYGESYTFSFTTFDELIDKLNDLYCQGIQIET